MAKKRKTRQEKKIAELRRKLMAQKRERREISQVGSTSQDSPEKTKLPAQKAPFKKDSPLQTFSPEEVKGDLLKTLILSALAISLELVVYFILRQA